MAANAHPAVEKEISCRALKCVRYVPIAVALSWPLCRHLARVMYVLLLKLRRRVLAWRITLAV